MRFDATLKKLFRQPPNRLLSYALGKPVTVVRMLSTDLVTVQNLHPDMLFEDLGGELIHAEMHGYHMLDFARRNFLYLALLLRDYNKFAKQIVFWIGPERVGITAGLDNPPDLHYAYRVIDVRDIDASLLLDGSREEAAGVGECIFAILCKFDNKRNVIAEILRRIATLPLADQKEAIAELLVLSGLRGLKAAVKEEVARMPISLNIHENEFLEEIYQEGFGMGIEKGIEKGSLEASRAVLLTLFEEKFGHISSDAKERVSAASQAELNLWLRKAIRLGSLEEVFAPAG